MDGFTPHIIAIFRSVAAERQRQDSKWGRQDHDFGSWLAIFQEELGEACRAQMEARYRPEFVAEVRLLKQQFRQELVESIAVLVAAVECGDRNGWFK